MSNKYIPPCRRSNPQQSKSIRSPTKSYQQQRSITLKTEYRYKTIVIPKIKDKYVIVRDSKSNDTTFITGGCKLNEPPINCAKREFIEESKKSINISNLNLEWIGNFQSGNRSYSEKLKNKKERVIVKNIYNIYIINLRLNYTNFRSIQNKFNKYNNTSNEFKETSNIYLKSLSEIKNDPSMWSFMKINVIPFLN